MKRVIAIKGFSKSTLGGLSLALLLLANGCFDSSASTSPGFKPSASLYESQATSQQKSTTNSAKIQATADKPSNPSAETKNTSKTKRAMQGLVDFGDAKYVGRDQCADCHSGNHSTFLHTGMGQSLYLMTPDRIIEDWTKNNIFVDERIGLHYRMVRKGDSFYQQQFVLDQNGNEIAKDERRLKYAVGSGNHSRGYIIEEEGGLFQAPICWDPTMNFWMYCPGFETKNDNFSRETSYTCLFCHNGRVELKEGERNHYEEPFSLGIGCERCHGPGEKHIEFRKNPDNFWAEAGDPKDPIVNPRRLPKEERLQVCFQCHLGDTSATVRVFRHDRELKDYRPGMKLNEVLVPFRFKEPTEYDFSLVSQADRMILSKCYTESNGQMECLTCHNPHITVYSKEPGSFRENCQTCHQLDDCSAPQEKRNSTAVPDDCVSCHMRKAVTSDRKHALFTDHWIRKDINVESRDIRTNLEMEPILKEDFKAFGKGEQAYYTARAYFLRALESGPSIRTQLLEKSLPYFKEAIDNGFKEADAYFFWGKTLTFLNRWVQAEPLFRQTLAVDASHEDAQFALAQTLTRMGRPQEASITFAQMLERNPNNPMALSEQGRLAVMSGNMNQAASLFKQAIEQEPWNAMLHVNYGMTLASKGDFLAATEQGRKATILDPDSAYTWDFLAKAAQAAGLESESQEALRQRDARSPNRRSSQAKNP